MRDWACTLGWLHAAWSPTQLGHEVGLVDIYYMRTTLDFLTVADALLAHQGVQLVDDSPQHCHQFAMKKVGVEGVRDKDGLLAYIDSLPCGGVCGHGKITYSAFDDDLQALSEEGLIYAIHNDEIKRWVGFPRYRHLEPVVDSDVRGLFDSTAHATHGVRDHATMDRVLARENVPASLVDAVVRCPPTAKASSALFKSRSNTTPKTSMGVWTKKRQKIYYMLPH
eukprot:680496-Rhodomonas_salina.2